MKGKSILTNKIESEIELLERHVKMLNAIMEHEPIGIIRLSELSGHPTAQSEVFAPDPGTGRIDQSFAGRCGHHARNCSRSSPN